MDKPYGDKDLIANKFKRQLKTIRPKSKRDNDMLIDLVTEVHNVVPRLDYLEHDVVLKADGEFL